MRPISAPSIKKIIGLLMAGGLLLRLWGIRWGINVDYGFHPDEWPFNLIYQISQGDFSELGLSVWYNVYHFMSAFVYLVIRKGSVLDRSPVQWVSLGRGSDSEPDPYGQDHLRFLGDVDHLPGL